MKSATALISAAHAAVALASFVAVRGVGRTLDGIAGQGGGIAAYADGVADAVQWPMIAAWVALIVSLLAPLLARLNPPQGRPMRSAVLAAVAISSGIAAVFMFREGVTFITSAMLPPGTPAEIVLARVTSASAITAACFAAAILVTVVTLRAQVTMRVAVMAVVVSLSVSATMIVTLRDLSAVYAGVAMGNTARLREVQRLP